MKKQENKKPQPKYVHIHAKCDFFELFEQVLESKSVQRCKEIKKMFLGEVKRRRVNFHENMLVDRMFDTTKTKYENNLQVKTRLVNPTLFSV